MHSCTQHTHTRSLPRWEQMWSWRPLGGKLMPRYLRVTVREEIPTIFNPST